MSAKETGVQNLPDNTIIDLYWDRNELAITETDKKYGKYLYVIAYNILNNRLDSEESLNDTYLATWNRIPPTRPNVLQRFLSKITRDISVDKYRKAHAQRRVPTELMISLDELEECIAGTISDEESESVTAITHVLNTYLHTLSEKDRFVFVCRYYYADSVAFIAKMLAISEKTIYRDLSRMREELREALRQEGIII